MINFFFTVEQVDGKKNKNKRLKKKSFGLLFFFKKYLIIVKHDDTLFDDNLHCSFTFMPPLF